MNEQIRTVERALIWLRAFCELMETYEIETIEELMEFLVTAKKNLEH